jgi:hypothetical protein
MSPGSANSSAMSILRVHSPIPAARALEAQIADLREQVFALADTARCVVPYEFTTLHVSLQSASNELGAAERVLRDAEQLPAAV